MLARETVADPRMLAEVAEGLSSPQKELSPKYFYDATGARLFEDITLLPEYYPTRAELAILREHAADIARAPEAAEDLAADRVIPVAEGAANGARSSSP